MLKDQPKPIYFGAEYMGGHKMYPKKTDCDVRMYPEGIHIEWGKIHKTHLVIHYDTITAIENQDEKRITKTRILLTGFIIGLLWKKRFLYTVIEYKDAAGIDQAIVLDFHRKADEAQQIIYRKMVEAKGI